MTGYQHIVCGTDFSASSWFVVQRAVRIARSEGAELTLLHVVQRFPVDRSNESIVPEDIDPAEYHEEQARAELNRLASQLDYASIHQELVFSERSAKNAILEYIEQHPVDLIVLGSQGHHGIAPAVGSTACAVVNSAKPDVLVVNSKEGRASE